MPKSKKKLSKKQMINKAYSNGYAWGRRWIKEFGNLHPVPLPDEWSEGYQEGFVDGFNDSLELLRIEQYA